MKALLFVFLIFSFQNLYAAPTNVHFVFLSEVAHVSLHNLVMPKDVRYSKFAQSDMDVNCLPMGDKGCFHPQLGYIEKTNHLPVIKPKVVKLKTFNSSQVSLVDCKENNYFDIFCGQAKNEIHKKKSVEVWIDTSSSMRKMDSVKEGELCKRQMFLKKISRKCKESDISYSTFNTSIKVISEKSISCNNYGLNDSERLIEWIKSSKAKYLYIITDIDELNSKLSDFIDSIGATVEGAAIHKFSSANLLDFSKHIIKNCNQK